MPIPVPNLKETRQEFTNRCMSDEAMNKEYPRQDQRLAVCYLQWRDR